MNANDGVHGRFYHFALYGDLLAFFLFLLLLLLILLSIAFYAIENNDIIITIFIIIIIIYWRLFNLCHTMRKCISTRSLGIYKYICRVNILHALKRFSNSNTNCLLCNAFVLSLSLSLCVVRSQNQLALNEMRINRSSSSCDGGNTSGSIVSEKKKKMVKS